MAATLLIAVAACGTGSRQPSAEPGRHAAQIAQPAPVDECRELGGGWQWRGSRDAGTSSIGLDSDHETFDAESGEATLSVAPLDDEEFERRVASRDAAGWTVERLAQLDLVGLDYEWAVAASSFEGTHDEFLEQRHEVERMLDDMPRCGLS